MKPKKKPIAKLKKNEKIVGHAVKPEDMNPYYQPKGSKNGKAKNKK